jgi:hypothetical protein
VIKELATNLKMELQFSSGIRNFIFATTPRPTLGLPIRLAIGSFADNVKLVVHLLTVPKL